MKSIFARLPLFSFFARLIRKDRSAFKDHYEVPIGSDMESVAKILRALGYDDLRDQGKKIIFTRDIEFVDGIGVSATTKLSIDVTLVVINKTNHLRFKLRDSQGISDVQSLAFKSASEFHKLYSADWQN